MNTDDFKWDDNLVVEFTTWSLNNSPDFQGRYADIEQFKKSKQKKPLFTTEDGRDAYDGDVVYWINTTTNSLWSISGIKIKKPYGCFDFASGKYFSTEEKAEEYIKWNKPQYSLTEVSKAIYKYGGNGLVILDNLSKQKSS